MKLFSIIKKSHLVFGLLFGIYFSFFLWQRWHNDADNGWKKIIDSDGKGYYAYLTHLFIEGNLEFRSDEHLYAVPAGNGKYINRFYCGTSILETPFFLLGYGTALVLGYELNGYSEPFAFWMTMSAIFYVLAGFYFIYVILQKRFGITQNNALLIISVTALGTNIIYYATVLPTFSHAYSFFTIALFAYQFYKTIDASSSKNILLSALFFSLIVMIRPVNGVVLLLIPFFFSGWKEMVQFFKTIIFSKKIIFVLIGGLIPVFIQCWLWYMQTGNWIEWSYKQEGFNFSHPEIFRVLFSFRRGLFIYAPLLLISTIGFYFLWKKDKWKSIWLLTFLLLFTYVISSWWHWTYGDTFGMRPFNDVLIIFIFLYAFLIINLNKTIKKAVLILSFMAIYMNLVYAYQFNHDIIRNSNMDRKKFMMVFMKTSDKYKNYFGGVNDIPPYAPNGFETIYYYENQYQESKFLQVDQTEFPGGTEFIFPKEKGHIRHVWMEISFKRKLVSEDGMKDVLFVIHTHDGLNDTTKLYATERIKEYPKEESGKWEEIFLRIWLPNSFDGGDKISLYLWNKGKEQFALDDFKIHVKLPIW